MPYPLAVPWNARDVREPATTMPPEPLPEEQGVAVVVREVELR